MKTLFFFHKLLFKVETPCISHPCLNGGVCIDMTAIHDHDLDVRMLTPSSMYKNGYYCKCSPGYTGTNCEGIVYQYVPLIFINICVVNSVILMVFRRFMWSLSLLC